MTPEQFEQLSDEDKARLRAQLHPYMQASLVHQLDPAVANYKFQIGQEVRHMETGGVYIIIGLPNENVIKEGKGWTGAYAYLMYDGRVAYRSRKQMEDGRFVQVKEGTAAEYAEYKAEHGIDFDEFVKYGQVNADSLIDGMPWSFSYKGHPVTHENDNCYFISLPGPSSVLIFNRGDRLVERDGELTIVKAEPDAE